MFCENEMNNIHQLIPMKRLGKQLPSNLSLIKEVESEKSFQSKGKYRSDEVITINNDKENNDGFHDQHLKINDHQISTTLIKNQKTKNRGLTYENGRRNLKFETVTEEEKERRAKRRERNRVAAQKCRERRQHQIDELQLQVDFLRSTEQRLFSTLKELSDEENKLRIKLSKHNCVISDNGHGEVSLMIRPCYAQDTYCHLSEEPISSKRRPNSLTVPIQGYPSILPLSTDQPLTPLLRTDTYNILKNQFKTELTPKETKESSTKLVFSWSNAVVEQLMTPSSEPSSNFNYLTTPKVDIPYYCADSYSHKDDQFQDIKWPSS